MVEIRLVDPAASHLLDRVAEGVFDHPVQPHLLAGFLADPSHALAVAVEEGRAVGMATGVVCRHPDKPPALFINEVGVAERLHRQGIGKSLVHRLLDWGREKGCQEAWVATEADNIPARRLYESTGGSQERELAVVYAYDLSQG